MTLLCTVVGARPNFMKMAPVIDELRRRSIPQVFVHTGQHYDDKMSKIFFDELGMPVPDVYLGVGSGSHAEQTAKVMTAFDRVVQERGIDGVVVAGDVNSTLACALVAAKLAVKVAHVESGLRSFDRGMPEETNRVLTDHVSDLLFCTEPSGVENLQHEGIENGVHLVGNSMIDSLARHRERAIAAEPWRSFHLERGAYGVVTLHRPSNVDDASQLDRLATALAHLSERVPLVFPVHPRTLARGGDRFRKIARLTCCEPLGYLEFLGLMAGARVVVTDSGGIQEETTALGVQCLTLRENTERPITITEGTNRLVAADGPSLVAALDDGVRSGARVPAFWDGRAAVRIVDVIAKEWARG